MSAQTQTIQPATMTTAELATYLKVAPITIRRWRCEKRVPLPPSVKVGGAVRYLRADVDAWLRDQREEQPHEA